MLMVPRTWRGAGTWTGPAGQAEAVGAAKLWGLNVAQELGTALQGH